MIPHLYFTAECQNQMVFILQVLRLYFSSHRNVICWKTCNILISVEDQQKELVALRFKHIELTRLYSQGKGWRGERKESAITWNNSSYDIKMFIIFKRIYLITHAWSFLLYCPTIKLSGVIRYQNARWLTRCSMFYSE